MYVRWSCVIAGTDLQLDVEVFLWVIQIPPEAANVLWKVTALGTDCYLLLLHCFVFKLSRLWVSVIYMYMWTLYMLYIVLHVHIRVHCDTLYMYCTLHVFVWQEVFGIYQIIDVRCSRSSSFWYTISSCLWFAPIYQVLNSYGTHTSICLYIVQVQVRCIHMSA